MKKFSRIADTFSTIRLSNFHIAILIAVIMVLRFALLSAYPLLDTTESRYAEIAREMVQLGDWVTPRLDPQTPFWGKPPLAFWLTAICLKFFGVSEFSARLSSFVVSLLLLFVTVKVGQTLYGKRAGMLAGLILASSGLFYVQAGFVALDALFGFCILLALSGFLLSAGSHGKDRVLYQSLFAVGLGLAIMAKGLAGAVMIGGPILLWAVFAEHTRGVLRLRYLLAAAAIACAVFVPWHVLAEAKTPGFLRYYLLGEHFGRFLVHGWDGDLYGHAHSEPLGMIWLYAFGAMMPWIVPVGHKALQDGLAQTWQRIRSDDQRLFLFLWTLFPVVFFTFARNILLPYVYPSIPPFAILSALILSTSTAPAEVSPQRSAGRSSMWAVCTALTPAAFLVAALCVVPRVGHRRSQRDLIDTYLQMPNAGQSELVYLTEKPYSADFYLQGYAKDISKSVPSAVHSELADGKPDYFVYNASRVQNLPELMPNLEAVGTFGDYVLAVERPGTQLRQASRRQKKNRRNA